MSKKVLITGITGQDGSYMAEYLLSLEKEIEVYGMVRRTSQINDINYKHLLANSKLKVVRGDLSDSNSINSLVKEIKPDYFINFAAQSFVGDSWQIPEETFMACAVGVLKCLEAIRQYHPSCRFYNAGSSEQFGDVIYSPQDEAHPFRPRSPYGAAKCAAHHLVKVYRESYSLYAIQGLLFNHESERRGEEFVTRKITKGFAQIAKALESNQPFEPIYLGNVDSKRDWSHALDFVDAIWRMLNQEKYNDTLLSKVSGYPYYITKEDRKGAERHLQIREDTHYLSKHIKEYVCSSGKSHSIKDFIKVVTDYLGYETTWQGQGVDAKLVLDGALIQKLNAKSDILVSISPKFYRPADVETLLGVNKAISEDLGWKQKISFDSMVKRMVFCDLYDAGILNTANYANPYIEKGAETASA